MLSCAGRAENDALLEQEFDYIFFTGSTAVGRVVMEAASVQAVWEGITAFIALRRSRTARAYLRSQTLSMCRFGMLPTAKSPWLLLRKLCASI